MLSKPLLSFCGSLPRPQGVVLRQSRAVSRSYTRATRSIATHWNPVLALFSGLSVGSPGLTEPLRLWCTRDGRTQSNISVCPGRQECITRNATRQQCHEDNAIPVNRRVIARESPLLGTLSPIIRMTRSVEEGGYALQGNSSTIGPGCCCQKHYLQADVDEAEELKTRFSREADPVSLKTPWHRHCIRLRRGAGGFT